MLLLLSRSRGARLLHTCMSSAMHFLCATSTACAAWSTPACLCATSTACAAWSTPVCCLSVCYKHCFSMEHPCVSVCVLQALLVQHGAPLCVCVLQALLVQHGAPRCVCVLQALLVQHGAPRCVCALQALLRTHTTVFSKFLHLPVTTASPL